MVEEIKEAEPSKIFFPLDLIPVHDTQRSILLLNWAWNNNIEIPHIVSAQALMNAGNVVAPNQKAGVVTVMVFFGALATMEGAVIDLMSEFEEIFGFPYATDQPPYVFYDIQKMTKFLEENVYKL